jgi:hypothetical protein
MPQILAVTTQGHYTEPQRDVLRADIMRQLDGCDAVVLILPPGVQLQNTFLPAAAVVVPRKVDDVMHVAVSGKVGTNDIVRPADEHSTWGNWQEGQAQREVQHVDVPDDEPAGIPPHVWLYRNMLTDLQALAPLGRDETNGQYAVAIDQLTDEQRAIPHVAKQLDELNGN